MPGDSAIGWHPPRPVDGEPTWEQVIYGQPLMMRRVVRLVTRGPNKGLPITPQEEMTTALSFSDVRAYLGGLIHRNVQ